MNAPVLDRVVGQRDAVRVLRASVASPVHAYLFVGPPGTGRRDAAISFAAALFCPDGGCGVCETCRSVLAGLHPDLVVVERQGASISMPQAREVTQLALRSPRSAPYQVLVLVDFHLVGPAAPALLKTIEEPPASTIIIVLADGVPADFVTIASRCLRVEFGPLSEPDLVDALVAEGCERPVAEAVAQASEGRLDRARVLRWDAGFGARLARWRQVPVLIDGTGATAVKLAAELLAAANEPVEVVKGQHVEELARLTGEAEASGERGIPGRAAIDARHRRELRRARTDDLRAGLAVLSGVYRGRLLDGGGAGAGAGAAAASALRAGIEAIELLDEAALRLTLNVNEALLLEWLLVRLDRVGVGAGASGGAG